MAKKQRKLDFSVYTDAIVEAVNAGKFQDKWENIIHRVRKGASNPCKDNYQYTMGNGLFIAMDAVFGDGSGLVSTSNQLQAKVIKYHNQKHGTDLPEKRLPYADDDGESKAINTERRDAIELYVNWDGKRNLSLVRPSGSIPVYKKSGDNYLLDKNGEKIQQGSIPLYATYSAIDVGVAELWTDEGKDVLLWLTNLDTVDKLVTDADTLAAIDRLKAFATSEYGITFKPAAITDQPHFIPAKNVIKMPDNAMFISNAELFSTLVHEVTHAIDYATASDEDKELWSKNDPQLRGMREAITELVASYVANQTGFGDEQQQQNSLTYIANWVLNTDQLAEDLLTVSADASRLARIIVNAIDD